MIFFFKKVYLFIWLCWVFATIRRPSLVAASGGYTLVAVVGLLVAVSSLVEHGL